MQTIDAAELAEHQRRAGVVARHLVWFTARNRSTGEPESLGLWSGEDARVFTVDSEDRTYYGPALTELPVIEGGVGLDVRYLDLEVPHLADEVQQLLRGYDPRLAAVEIHLAVFAAATNTLVAPPRRVFKGSVNELVIATGAAGGSGGARLSLASAARALTRTLPLYRSHADQRARNATDRFREYASTVGLREVVWGEKSVRPAGAGRDGGSA